MVTGCCCCYQAQRGWEARLAQRASPFLFLSSLAMQHGRWGYSGRECVDMIASTIHHPYFM